MAISDFSNIGWVYVPFATTFASKFPIIYDAMQRQEIPYQISKVFMANIHINDNKNLDSTLALGIDDSSATISIMGDFSFYTGLIVIDDEIMYVSNGTYLFSQYTTFICSRGQEFTKAFAHTQNRRIRGVIELDVINYTYSHKSTATNTSIFAPVLSSGEFSFLDDVKKWIITSNSKEYDLGRNKPVYIFEGANKQMKCMFQGYVYDWETDAKSSEVTIMLKDEFTLINAKNIDYTKTYINQYTVDVIEDLLGTEVFYMNDTDKEHYGRLDIITTADYDTYGSLLSYICEAKCMRLSYDEYGFVRVYSDLFKATDTYNTDLEVTDYQDLIDINETTENTLVLNKFTSTFKSRFPYFNRNQFLDGSTLRYINFRYTTPNKSLVLLNTQGFIPFDVDLGDNIKFLAIGDTILVKERFGNKLEFRCKLMETTGTVGTFIGSFDRDRAWNPRGKVSWLLTNGYSSVRSYDVFYSEINLQTIFALGLEIQGENKVSNLKLPILPGEELEYNCTFGSFETNDLKFSGIVQDIEGIYGSLTNTKLLYMKDYEQSETGTPVYLLTNKLRVEGTGQSQLYFYNSFDNSNINVEISEAQDNESNIIVKIKNTMTAPTTNDLTPITTIFKILEVSFGWWNTIYTGDVLKLHIDNTLDSRTLQYYNLNSDAKWTVESKFQDGSKYYITLDKAYPKGDDNIQMKFTLYRYDKIIHLNEFRIMGNPIVEQEQNLQKLNVDSINKYDEVEYKFDGKLTNLDDLKYAISYLYNNYAGLPNEFTRSIPFEALFRPDIDLLSVVKLYDSSITDMDAQEVIVIEKTVSKSDSGRDEKYVGITKAQHLANLSLLDNVSDLHYYKTLYPTIYNHQGNEGQSSEIEDKIDNKYMSRNSKIGNISILKIDTKDYYGVVSTTIRNDERNLTIALYGDTATYNTSMFKLNHKSVLMIGTEYLLVESQSNITSSSTSVIVKIIERDIFGTGQYEITQGQVVQMCQILQYSDENGMVIDGVITIGSNNGRIEFLESDLVIDDYAAFFSSERGIRIFEKSDNVQSKDLMSISRAKSNGQTTFRMNNLSSLPKYFEMILNDSQLSPMDIRLTQIGSLGSTISNYGIRVNGLIVGNITSTTTFNGALKFESNHFYGYNGSAWKQLDNEAPSTPYPGYASRVILPNRGTSYLTGSGELQWVYDNLYFNTANSTAIPCLTQFSQTFSSNTQINPYVNNHCINVTSSAITVSINYSPGNFLVAGKEYEIIHLEGNVGTNNITISGGSNTFYALGGASLGTTLTINTTGGRIKLLPTNNKWYAIVM